MAFSDSNPVVEELNNSLHAMKQSIIRAAQAEQLRRLSLNHLNEALYQCARHTMIYLAENNIPQHPATQEVLAWFHQLAQEETTHD